MPTTLIYGKERNTSDARILIQTERLYGVNPGEIRDRLTLGKAPLVPEKIALARRDLPSLQAEPRTRQQALKLEVALFALAQAEKYGLPSDWRPGPRNGWTRAEWLALGRGEC